MALLDYLNKDVDKIIPYNTGKRINEVARELGLNPESFVKLASNECPLGPSPKAVEAIKKFASNVHRYPDGSAYLLKNKCSILFQILSLFITVVKTIVDANNPTILTLPSKDKIYTEIIIKIENNNIFIKIFLEYLLNRRD